jgi:hypothetical protein
MSEDGSSDSDDLSRRGVSLAGVYHERKFTAESEPDGAVVEIRRQRKLTTVSLWPRT